MKPLLPLILAAPLLLAACDSATTARDAVLGEEVKNADGTASVDTCGASAYLELVGQKNPAIKVSEGTPYRTYREGDAITEDFALKRLNFVYDKTGKLLSVTCG